MDNLNIVLIRDLLMILVTETIVRNQIELTKLGEKGVTYKDFLNTVENAIQEDIKLYEIILKTIQGGSDHV